MLPSTQLRNKTPPIRVQGDYQWLPYPPIAGAGNVTMNGGVNNTVYGNKFALRNPIKVSKIAFRVIIGSAGAKGGIAIYDKNGNLVIDFGAEDLTSNNTNHIKTLTTPVILPTGIIYPMWNCTNGVVTCNGIASIVNGLWLIAGFEINVNAANAASAGVFPATLGAISAFGSSTPSMIIL